MFGIIVYLGECLVAAAILTSLYIVMRSIKARDEIRSWRVFVGVFVAVLALPFSTVEIITRIVGKKMEPAVKEVIAESDFAGKLDYYKVLFLNGKSARVIAVGTEKEEWGGSGLTVIAMTLRKEGQSWKPDSFRYVQSDKRNVDGITFPPYW